MKTLRRIILGSSSPHRQAVLKQAGVTFEVMAADIDEKAIRHDDPRELTLALADAKRDAISARLGPKDHAVLITCDQVVVYDGQIREKPESPAMARLWLEQYGTDGGEIQFVTSVVVTDVHAGEVRDGEFAIDIARFTMRPLGSAITEALLLQGKVLGVAGAITIEDQLIKAHGISLTNGMNDPLDARTSAVGLPIVQTLQMLQAFEAVSAA